MIQRKIHEDFYRYKGIYIERYMRISTDTQEYTEKDT